MKNSIPLEILFGNPVKTRAKISPDGGRISYIAPFKGIKNIWIKTIGKDDGRVLTNETINGIEWSYFWAYNNRHIIYEQDDAGDENLNVFITDTQTGKIKNLTPHKNIQARVLAVNKNYPDEILVVMNLDDPKLKDVYKINLRTGETTLESRNPGNVTCWFCDNHLITRLALQSRKDGGFNLLFKNNGNPRWKKIREWSIEEGITGGPEMFAGFNEEGNGIYLIDPKDSNTFRLVELNIETGEVKILVEDPASDVKEAFIDPDTFKAQAVLFQRARCEWMVIDESLAVDFERIRGLENGDFTIVNMDNANENWIVNFIKDNSSPSYYLYNRKTGKGELLFNEQPALDNYCLSSVEQISFTSRDGLTIHGYLSCPTTIEKKNLPLVLKVHGGPWWRDSWEFNPEVQFFTSLGYACLQINYRGSTGYGKEFINAADREWAGKVLKDLEDGVKFVIDMGIVDPRKIAIYGRSWGGYCALLASATMPGMFCCAVDVYGISSLVTFIESIPPYWEADRALLAKRIGDPDTEREFLEKCSPLYLAKEIKIPLFIAHGENDVHVKKSESDQIVKILKKNKIPHQYLVFSNEGHGFNHTENRVEFYKVLQEFLEKYVSKKAPV